MYFLFSILLWVNLFELANQFFLLHQHINLCRDRVYMPIPLLCRRKIQSARTLMTKISFNGGLLMCELDFQFVCLFFFFFFFFFILLLLLFFVT